MFMGTQILIEIFFKLVRLCLKMTARTPLPFPNNNQTCLNLKYLYLVYLIKFDPLLEIAV